MKIHYICAYAEPDRSDKYRVTPSGIAKITYIKEAIKKGGFELSLFSPICCRSDDFKLIGMKKTIVDDAETQYYPFSMGGSNSIIRCISYVLIYIQLFTYLLFRVHHGDKVLLYHSNPDTRIMMWLSSILHFELFLELEEIYSAVFHKYGKIKKEKQLVGKCAKGYIVVNNIIAEKCCIRQPYVVCEGQYEVLYHHTKNLKGENNKINVLYAGALEDNADVFMAIASAKYLGSDYQLHICGYGNSDVVSKLSDAIKEHNNEDNECNITFYGCLHGEEYENLLSKCSIGLCSRILEDELSDYTFPSKVFAYLARNLKVVCTPISCVLKSTLADSIVFSKCTSPQSLADAILSIDKASENNNANLLNNEHNRFVTQITYLFNHNKL